MKRLIVVLLVAVIVGLVGVGVASAGAQHGKGDATWWMWNPCNNDYAILQVHYKWVMNSHQDESGQWHYTYHSNLKGEGNGRYNPADEYKFKENYNYTDKFDPEGYQYHGVGQSKLFLNGKQEQLIRWKYFVTYKDGEWTVKHNDYEVVCK